LPCLLTSELCRLSHVTPQYLKDYSNRFERPCHCPLPS
jgi:hypothetical protein